MTMTFQETEATRTVAFFVAHVSMTSYFSVVGIWWTYNILRDYHACRLSNGKRRFRSRMFYVGGWPGRPDLPLEILLKVVVFSFLDATVVGACVLPGFRCQVTMHSQHLMTSLPLLLSAVVDLMAHYEYPVPLPPDTDRAVMVVVAGLVGILLESHSHAQTMLNSHMHAFIPRFAAAIVVVLVVDGCYRSSLMAALARTLVFTVGGSWMAQVAYDLFPVFPWQTSRLDENSVANVVNVPSLFVFHVLAVVVLFLVMNMWITKRTTVANRKWSTDSLDIYKNHGV